MSQQYETSNHLTCPFCLYGCELAIVSSINNYVRNVEYLPNAQVNQGRLCPRGNAASIVLSDKKRLAYPLFENKTTTWSEAVKLISRAIKQLNKEALAITFDKNLTAEEMSSICGFANELGIENFASSYLEPDSYFSFHLENCPTSKFEDLAKTKVFILMGDVFALTPVIAKPILTARYAERNHRIFVIDSIQTRTAGFADRFLWCRAGTEPLITLAISSLISGKIKGFEIEVIADISGVAVSTLEEVASSFTNLNPGMVISAMNYGRNENPYLFSLAGQILATKTDGDKKFLAMGEAKSSFGKVGFGTIYNNIKQAKIKAWFNFGDTFPFAYPQLLPEISEIDNFGTTALFRSRQPFSGFILPTATNLEKTGTIRTLWGETKQINPIAPVSGSKTAQETLELLNQALGLTGAPGPKYEAKPVTNREVYDQARDFLAIKKAQPTSEKGTLLLLGEKPAIGFLNYFDRENIIKINPKDFAELELNDNKLVQVANDNYRTELAVKVTNQVPKGLALIGVNRIENRNFFPFVVDNVTNNVIFPPTIIRLWQT